MKEPVQTETDDRAIARASEPILFTAHELIDWLFPGQTRMNLMRLVVSGDYAGSQLECWLRARWLDDGTREWAQADGGYAERSRPTVDVLLSQYASVPVADPHGRAVARSYTVPGTTVGISPFLCRQMSSQIAEPWPAIWAAVKVRVFPPSYGAPIGIVDVGDHEKIRERFMALSTPPHVLIDEGSRLVGLWRLDTPFEDREDPIPEGGMTSMQVIARVTNPIPPKRASRLLFRLAHSLQGDITDMARSENAVILLPGQKVDLRMADVPSLIVTASCFDSDARTTIEALEEMADTGIANLRG